MSTPRIPDNIKEEILERSRENIVAIVGNYVELTKAGSLYKACCPFHDEKTPSFTVDPKRGTARCFGECGEGGDATWFIRKLKGYSFPEALHQLASLVGVTIPNGESEEEKERKAILRVLNKAQEFFVRSLTTKSNAGSAYVQSRFSPETVEAYGIGWAPSDGRALAEYLERENLSLQVAERAGLLRKEENKPYQDYFWGRVMFPIRCHTGHIIGFAGRSIVSGAKVKYLNPPETPVYKKAATLYGLDTAIQAIRETGEAFVGEGYTDRISMRSAGIPNSVAACGTAFTRDHLAVLKRYGVKRLHLMFDGDAAGRKALQKSILMAMKEEVYCTAYLFDEGQDPDSYFKSGGTLAGIKSMSGLDCLQAMGAEMSPTLQKLHRLERLEKGVLFMVEQIPEVRKLLARRGGLEELFSPELLPAFQEAIYNSTAPPRLTPSEQRVLETLKRVEASLTIGSAAEPEIRAVMLQDVREAMPLLGN